MCIEFRVMTGMSMHTCVSLKNFYTDSGLQLYSDPKRWIFMISGDMLTDTAGDVKNASDIRCDASICKFVWTK